MSALRIVKQKNHYAAGTCDIDGCSNRARRTVEIAGIPQVVLFGELASRFWICDSCARKWRKTWDEASGAKALREVEAAVRRLGEPGSVGTEAAFELRELGCDSAAVVEAQRRAKAGVDVERIVAGLAECDDELEAVA